MTTAGPEKVWETVSWLCDVPLPDEGRRHYHEAGKIRREDQHGLLGADRWRQASSEGGRRDALKKCRRVLAYEQVADPFVRAAVDAVDEAHRDDLDRKDVDQADAERSRRVPDYDAESQTDGAVHRQDEPYRSDPFG